MLFIYKIYCIINAKDKRPYPEKIKKIQENVKKSDKIMVKDKSNHLFGLKKFKNTGRINLSNLNNIIKIDTSNNIIELEGSCTVKQILEALLPIGYMLPIIPDMSFLNIGGIVSGVGGGSASFRNGTFHDSMIECDVLLGDGSILTCSEKENSDLFRTIPNALGTLGYITKLKMRIVKSKPYVKTKNYKFDNFKEFQEAINKYKIDSSVDFLDGTIFDSKTFDSKIFVCVVGKLQDNKPEKLDNFVNHRIYWKSIQEDEEHNFELLEYIYRWDTDLYYTSINEKIPQFINNATIRSLVPKKVIPLVKSVLPYMGLEINIDEFVQDVLIPMKNAEQFYKWYDKEIGVYPVYICPSESKGNKFDFWTDEYILDFGLGYGIIPDNAKEQTLKVEKKMLELGGRKLLYSIHQMSEKEFWSIYNKEKYETLRKKYKAKFPNIFDKLKIN